MATKLSRKGVTACGLDIKFGGTVDPLVAELMGLSGIGFTRATIDGTTNNSPDHWGEIILSCIKRMKPMQIEILFSPDEAWIDAADRGIELLEITFPPEEGQTQGAGFSVEAAITEFEAGGELEDKFVGTITLTPHGKPTKIDAQAAGGP